MFLLDVSRALEKHNIQYALVGGFAVALHGAVRGTVDVDVVVALDQETFLATEAALLELGLQSKLPVHAKEVFQFREEYIKNRNLIAWSFFDPSDSSKIVDVIITENVAKMERVKKRIADTTVYVAAIPSLIEMKQRSARPQDLEDIKALRKLESR